MNRSPGPPAAITASARRGPGRERGRERERGGDRGALERRAAPLVALGLGALALTAFRATLVALPNLQLDAPLVPPVNASDRAVTSPGRVLLVVLDGLRADVARDLPFLRALGDAGAWADLVAEPPVYSSAEYVAMMTGVPPRDSGVRTNTRLRATPLDDVPRRLRAAGRRAVEIGDGFDWSRLFGADFVETQLVAPDALGDAAARALPRADLAVVHVCGIDEAGHVAGASSPAYRAAARAADETTLRLARAWGWPDATVVVLADHGHVARGGHGGDEPDVRQVWLAAGGPRVRARARVARARMIDVAPTLAALLGTPAPGTAEGRALVEALVLTPAEQTALAAADRERAPRALAAGEVRRRVREADEARARFGRAAALLAIALLGIAAFARARRRRRAVRLGLLVGAATLLATVALHAARYGWRPSFSADRTAEHLGVGVALLSIAAGALPFGWAFVAAARARLGAPDAAAFAIGAVAGGAPIAALTYVFTGAFQERVICEPAWLAALPLVAYAAFAPPVLAAALVVAAAALVDRAG